MEPSTTYLGSNAQEFSVSEISTALKYAVEKAFNYVRVRGEISGFKRAASGHIYFSLKDEKSVLNAVCWKGVAGRLSFAPEDGLEVICTGRITTYAGRSYYQIVVEKMEPAGEGALMALLEKRKKQLAAEGLFDAERKKPLPYLPEVIGVVTSPTGAVIRDILHRIEERYPLHVLVWPVLVQGEGAAEQIAHAIEGFNLLEEGGKIPRPDLLIVARGGGSLEDLWAFNEEIVVRATAASDIPLLSAVGHETDTTLIDYASSRRAPTPTAAAEIAVPVKAELQAGILDYQQRLFSAMSRKIEMLTVAVSGLARGLLNPHILLENMVQRLDDWSERLQTALPALLQHKTLQLANLSLQSQPLLRDIEYRRSNLQDLTVRSYRAFDQKLNIWQQHVKTQGQLLESYHYEKVLSRGFALVRNGKGELITSTKAISAGMEMQLELSDGKTDIRASGVAKKTVAKKTNDDGQESLF